ncbi:MAG: hypothetical protein WEE89_11920 [Gemmatimonadota bacterium]
MSDTSHELINVVPSEVPSRSIRAEHRRLTLVYWGHLTKWFVLLIVLALASVLLGEPPNAMMSDAGLAAAIVCAVAAFPAGIAVAMHKSSLPHVPERALLASTLLLALGVIGLTGFVLPMRAHARLGDSNRDRINPVAVTLLGVREARLALLSEIQSLRSSLDREQRSRARAGLGIIEPEQRRRLSEQYSRQDERVHSQIRRLTWRIRELNWRNQLVIAAALLPMLSTWLGFLTGRWSMLARPGMQRQLFKWTVGLCAVWTGGYTLLTGLVVGGSSSQGLDVQALPHVVFLPTLLLVLLGVSWMVIGRRIAPLAPQ